MKNKYYIILKILLFSICLAPIDATTEDGQKVILHNDGTWKFENPAENAKFNLIELGAGNGEMMKVIIESFQNFPILFKSCNFVIHEKSPSLVDIQKKKIGYGLYRNRNGVGQSNTFQRLIITGGHFF